MTQWLLEKPTVKVVSATKPPQPPARPALLPLLPHLDRCYQSLKKRVDAERVSHLLSDSLHQPGGCHLPTVLAGPSGVALRQAAGYIANLSTHTAPKPHSHSLPQLLMPGWFLHQDVMLSRPPALICVVPGCIYSKCSCCQRRWTTVQLGAGQQLQTRPDGR